MYSWHTLKLLGEKPTKTPEILGSPLYDKLGEESCCVHFEHRFKF